MFTPQEIETIAKKLHDIWMEAKLKQGWTYGPVKDAEKKTHPSLVPYEDLPEEQKELDRMFARNFAKILEKAGFKAVKGGSEYTLTNEDIEKLAKEAHNLWREKASPNHEYNKPYEELPEEAKELNRNTVKEMLQVLSDVGFSVQKASVKKKVKI